VKGSCDGRLCAARSVRGKRLPGDSRFSSGKSTITVLLKSSCASVPGQSPPRDGRDGCACARKKTK